MNPFHFNDPTFPFFRAIHWTNSTIAIILFVPSKTFMLWGVMNVAHSRDTALDSFYTCVWLHKCKTCEKHLNHFYVCSFFTLAILCICVQVKDVMKDVMAGLQQTNSEKILLSWVRQNTRQYPQVCSFTSLSDLSSIHRLSHWFCWYNSHLHHSLLCFQETVVLRSNRK